MMDEKRNASQIHGEERLQTPLFSGSAVLRRAIRRNIVSFPSQVPIFLKQPSVDMQWRMVLLYFVRGWSSAKIAERFNVPKHRIWKTLNEWCVRALALGYVQVIDPEEFAACCHAEVDWGTHHEIEEIQLAEFRAVIKNDPLPFPDAAPAMGAPPSRTLDGTPAGSLGKGADLIAALDAAITHCEDWRGEFWVRTATLLRDLRTVAAAAIEGGSGNLSHGLRVREEKRGSHAVA